MPRCARVKSESGFYHVIAKGSGGQNLFEGPYDCQAFLGLLSKACEKGGVRVIAYCLMSNHVHLLLEDPESHLGEVMKSALTGYAQRFNKRGDRVGHVFQQRFKSQPVENEDYLLRAVRYIHNNPEKAGICQASAFPWSSYHEYVGTPIVADTALVLELCGGVEGFVAFSAQEDGDDYRFRERTRISDGEARCLAERVLGEVALSDLKALERSRRNALLFELKNAGLSISQIQRLTGIGRNVIARAK
ncbi:MAG TPA: transposase [Candidatus Olsenella pullistercoris]|uniref:Transposase n=1 Tax=Candidatus Olsenella pullistercoris TaxID=2838712 RepID=A0A9D2EY28_9ACTN|nr:transposase [Candidatus Olsenella pullistercoris]